MILLYYLSKMNLNRYEVTTFNVLLIIYKLMTLKKIYFYNIFKI